MSSSSQLQVSPTKVLDFAATPSSSSRSIDLPLDICIGSGSSGGLLACILTKHAVLHAATNPRTKHQLDVRSTQIQFHRPIFPAKNPRVELQLHEISIGKAWSTFRVDLIQGAAAAIAVSATITLTNFSIPGISLPTHWTLTPPPPPFTPPTPYTPHAPSANWTPYHTAFHPAGFRRGMSYAAYQIPTLAPTPPIRYVEQWMAPGWDCHPSGSLDASAAPAKWTTELLHFAADLTLPVQENLRPSSSSSSSVGSVAATLAFAARQAAKRDAGTPHWRALGDDGHLPDPGLFADALINVSLSMSTEIKKALPREGVRWLYVRAEAKALVGNRMDLEVLVCDEGLELVAVSNQVVWIVGGEGKVERKGASL